MIFRISKRIPDAFGRIWPGIAGERPNRSPAGPEPMVAVHVTVGIAVLASNLVAGVLGRRSPGFATSPSVGFWYVLRVAQAAVVLQVGLGAILLLSGREAATASTTSTACCRSLVSLLAEAARAGAAERELEGLDFESLPQRAPAPHRAGDRPPRDRDHGRLGAGHLPARPAGRDDGGLTRPAPAPYRLARPWYSPS